MTAPSVLHMTCDHEGKLPLHFQIDEIILDINLCEVCMGKTSFLNEKYTKNDGVRDDDALKNDAKPVKIDPQFPNRNEVKRLDFDGSNRTVTYRIQKGKMGIDFIAQQHNTLVIIAMSRKQTIQLIKQMIIKNHISEAELLF